jgi:hypothetical protein
MEGRFHDYPLNVGAIGRERLRHLLQVVAKPLVVYPMVLFIEQGHHTGVAMPIDSTVPFHSRLLRVGLSSKRSYHHPWNVPPGRGAG